MTEQTEQTEQTAEEKLAALADDAGLEMSAIFVPYSQRVNRWKDSCGNDQLTINWECIFSVKGREFWRGPFSQGIGHLPEAWRGFTIFKYKLQQWVVEKGSIKGFFLMDGGPPSRKEAAAKLTPPSREDVLQCLLMDADALNYSGFEDWAETFGYDTNSRRAEGIYKECLKIALAFRAWLGSEALERMQEAVNEM